MPRTGVERFLDIEAEVEQDEEDLSDEERARDTEEAFINDDEEYDEYDDIESQTSQQLSNYEDEEALESFFQGILANSQRTRPRPPPEHNNEDHAHDPIALGALGPTDYPLWRVDCRIGIEEEAVFSLYATAKEHHQLRSAFTRGSIRGHIYLECTMNRQLRSLLRITPGVIVYGREGIRCTMVDPSDNRQLLEMKAFDTQCNIGDWVVVQQGLYKGDPALVFHTSSWGAELLLVPRLPTATPNRKKRKASTVIPSPALFDQESARQLFPGRVVANDDGSFSMGIARFHHGLLHKKYDYHAFTTDVQDISWDLYHKFFNSGHQHVQWSHMPQPREWSIAEGDSVILLSEGRTGVVVSTGVYNVLVHKDIRLDSEWGDVDGTVPWYDIRKFLNIGDYICVKAGIHAGETGWVLELKHEICTICSYRGTSEDIVTFEVFVNFTEVSQPPQIFSRPPEAVLQNQVSTSQESVLLEDALAASTRTRRHPWCGLHVVITKGPLKSRHGMINDVIGDHTQETSPEKIFLVVKISSYNPAHPFQSVKLTCADVRQLSKDKKMFLLRDPGAGYARPFQRSLDSSESNGASTSSWSRIATPSSWLTPRPESSTPMQSRASTPSIDQSDAWTVSSTPPDPSSPHVSSTPLTRSDRHYLHDNGLLLKEFRAIVTGGEFSEKEMTVRLYPGVRDNILQVKQRGLPNAILDPSWVTPKMPKAKTDNSLLMVTKGVDRGKFGRRIRYLDNHRGPYALEIAVVCRDLAPGTEPDKLTGERLTVPLEHLAVAVETKGEAAGKTALMEALRQPWKGTYA